jgi:hypothetical protein
MRHMGTAHDQHFHKLTDSCICFYIENFLVRLQGRELERPRTPIKKQRGSGIFVICYYAGICLIIYD